MALQGEMQELQGRQTKLEAKLLLVQKICELVEAI
jgi:hypothetical protein